MVTLFYDFDETSNTGNYEYVTDLSDWIDSLDAEDAFEDMYTIFAEYPKYFSLFNMDRNEVESITKEDKDLVKELLSLFDESDLLAEYKDIIKDYYYDEAESEFEENQ